MATITRYIVQYPLRGMLLSKSKLDSIEALRIAVRNASTTNKQIESVQFVIETGKPVYLIDVNKNNEIIKIKIDPQNGDVMVSKFASYSQLDEGLSEEYVEEISQVGDGDFQGCL
ncbi:MAG TPA: PepSY domain-containing protein [Candidatus Nitrosocosmicus sp.]|nr:PepSY domain-containing protein [Candidatus Nitrosocosmicus sp.]